MQGLFWNANLYKQGSSFQFEQAAQFVNENLDKFEGKDVLDIGCGVGNITALIAKKARRVVGVDLSESMIETAKKNSIDCENLFFQVNDFNDLPFNSEFDIVFSSFSIHWAQNKLVVFENIKKTLKPGGEFLIILVIRNEKLAEAREQAVTSGKWKKYFQDIHDPTEFAKEKDYGKYVESSGLKLSSNITIKSSKYFKDIEDFCNFLKNITPNLGYIPESLRDEFIHDIIKNYLLELNFVSTDQLPIDFECVKIIGEYDLNFSKEFQPRKNF